MLGTGFALLALTIQGIPFRVGAATNDSVLAAAIPAIARQALAAYAEPDRELALDNRLRLQIASGDYAGALRTVADLKEMRRTPGARLPPVATLPLETYARALQIVEAEQRPFAEAFRAAFRMTFSALDDRTAAVQGIWVYGTSVRRLDNLLRTLLEQFRDSARTVLAPADAVELVRRYLARTAYRSFAPFVPGLLGEDDERRYTIDRDIPLRTPDGATVCVMVMRPRTATGRIPALLNFTIYADSAQNTYEARRSASHGYAGVEGLTRGKGCSPDHPVPIEHDGADAAAVIDWISRQPWSDGRVGMYGGSYEGFTQWAAAKRMPPALKALMPSVTFAPGVDFPNPGNVFLTYAYPWPLYTTNVKGLDNATYNDEPRWQRLMQTWYTSGRAYRSLDSIDGTPNPVFRRWLEHPTYDAYWKHATPGRREFARIDIPVLTTTGYYDGGQLGALHYFTEHLRYRPGAEHYLVIGPYDHVTGQRGTMTPLGGTQSTVRGYSLDSVAHLDIGELRYQWFDYVLRGGSPKPALLRDRVNYQVMDANEWKHAPSLAAMHDGMVRYYLSEERSAEGFRLRSQPRPAAIVADTIDLADRRDAARFGPAGDLIDVGMDTANVVSDAPHIGNSLTFVGDPLATPTEVSGVFSGRLEVTTNKRDFDFTLTLFELTPEGRYVLLSYHWTRASHVGDRARRRLLTPGRRQRLDFVSGRLIGRRLGAGSRLVAVIGIIKQPGAQINYGTGKAVNDETIADAGEPLRVQWHGTSYIDVPTALNGGR